jgi:Asp-tRNA(Asn)/Glu-tRNA(Gln) amidotransferase A subunit family amidase
MFEELTITEYHRRLLAGEMKCRQLVDWYLERIDAIDQGKDGLNAVLTINSKARDEAEEADLILPTLNGDLPDLFGVPFLVKDQCMTAGLRTTFGSIAFSNFVPNVDAAVLTRIRSAGGVLLGKTTMCDLAAGWFSSSSISGHTSTPYDQNRDSGGSSAGSGAAVGANLCMVAVGEDTGGSIRIPGSFNNCYGLRVTTGLIPRTGFSPLVHFQDTPGPMARTLPDLMALLEVMVGYAEHDSATTINASRLQPSPYRYEDLPNPNRPWRIGVLSSAFGPSAHTECAAVNKVILDSIDATSAAGAEVIEDLEIQNLDEWIGKTSVYTKVSPSDITLFLQSLENSPVGSFHEIYANKQFHPENDLFDEIAGAPDNPDTDETYLKGRLAQETFRRVVLDIFAQSEVDVLVCPTVKVLPPTHEDLASGRFTCLTFPTNTVIASQAALPALSAPAGFTPDGLPVGLEIIGRPLDEKTVLGFAKFFEELMQARKAPPNREEKASK